MQLHNLATVLITAYQNAASVQFPLQKASLNRYACPWVPYVNGIKDSHRSGNHLDRVQNFPFLRMIKQRLDLLLS